MRVGEIIAEKKMAKWRECDICGLPAAFCITFLLTGNCRANPASNAYGRDDCSWCSDAEAFACRRHEREVRKNPPAGMSECSIFPLKKFKHMGFYFVKAKQPSS